MEYDIFMNLPTAEIAQIVRERGPHVCVFPINGTRRWFMLEHPDVAPDDFLPAYLEAMVQSHMRNCRLFFEHGLSTLVSPMLGSIILERGSDYIQVLPQGFAHLINHPEFKRLCRELEVRVRFFGEYHERLAGTPHEHLIGFMEGIEETVGRETAAFDRHRLFFGLFADHPADKIADLTVQYYLEHGRVPDKSALVERYYGEYVSPADLYIGFGKLATYDMPLLAVGTTNLYFTVAPSPYFSAVLLRRILYDHLFARQQGYKQYRRMQAQDWVYMRDFYRANSGNVLGIGKKMEPGGSWFPLPQVSWPDD